MQNTTKKAPLEDLMAAMDVVDTLRHRQLLVDRELDTDARRERLIEKLRGIYQAQGIEVSDQVLAEGVLAMEEDRFAYTPPERSFSTRLATLYIKRDKWLKPVMFGLAMLIALPILYYFAVVRPATIAQNALPAQLTQYYEETVAIAKGQGAISKAQELQTSGQLALKNENFDEAQTAVNALGLMLNQLKATYTIRVVQRPGERSGLLRIPNVNERARNYYLIVEAVDSNGNILTLPMANEESDQIQNVNKWGIRVAREVYQRIAADKQDDGIIQNRQVGKKERGILKPEYSIPTSGAAITSW